MEGGENNVLDRENPAYRHMPTNIIDDNHLGIGGQQT